MSKSEIDINIGFPLDQMLDEVDEPAPVDDWEKREQERKKKGHALLAKAIWAGKHDSEADICETICKFYAVADTMRGM